MKLFDVLFGRKRPKIYEENIPINEVLDSLGIRGNLVWCDYNHQDKTLKIKVESK